MFGCQGTHLRIQWNWDVSPFPRKAVSHNLVHYSLLVIFKPCAGSAIANEVQGRIAGESSNAQGRAETIAITKGWLESCNTSTSWHYTCNGGLVRKLPPRLVFIKKGSAPKICEFNPVFHERGCYAALSYTWGEDFEAMPKLLKENRSTFLRHPLNVDVLPLSQQHAILVARELCYEWIWIDMLCLVQDDDDDWERHARLLPFIYGNADLTIIAGRSRRSKDGFLQLDPRSRPSVPDARLQYQSRVAGITHCRIALMRNHLIGPTDNDSWCLQEFLMARRMLIYGEQQLSFRCRKLHQFEDGDCQFIGIDDDWYDLSFLAGFIAILEDNEEPESHPRAQIEKLSSEVNPAKVHSQPRPNPNELDGVLRRWYVMTAEYSSRTSKYPTDNHAAISGVVLLFQAAMIQRFGPNAHKYLAGLWEIDMFCGLLWRSRRIMEPSLPALRGPTWEGQAVQRAPTWSWMALEGPVYQGSRSMIAPIEGAYLTGEPRCTPANGIDWSPNPNHLGHWDVRNKKFPNPSLEINAYMREVRVSEYPTSDPSAFAIWEYTDHAMTTHTFLLEAAENPPLIRRNHGQGLDWSKIAAIGLLDLGDPEARVRTMWAMRVTTTEGLLLKKCKRPMSCSFVYERLGVFRIQQFPAFYPHDALEKSGYKYKVIEDNLQSETIVLV